MVEPGKLAVLDASAAAAALFGRYLCTRPVDSRTTMPRMGLPVLLPMPLPYPTRVFASGSIGMKPIGELGTPDTDESGTWPTYFP